MNHFLAEVFITLVSLVFISVTAIFSEKMEVTIIALLLLTLGVVNAEVCQRDGVDINTCTQCIWMSQDTNQRCKFCDDKDVTAGKYSFNSSILSDFCQFCLILSIVHFFFSFFSSFVHFIQFCPFYPILSILFNLV